MSESGQLHHVGDPSSEVLRYRVRQLRQRLTAREQQRDRLERAIYTFGVRYRKELGDLVATLMKLRREVFGADVDVQGQQGKARSNGPQVYQKHERYRLGGDGWAEALPPMLTDRERKELKAVYRAACKQCHPDLVGPEHREAAVDLFQELKTAYARENVERVKEIAELLEKGRWPGAPSTNAHDPLEAEVERLRARLVRLDREIEDLRTSDRYRALLGIGDMDAYFRTRRRLLKTTIERLRQHRQIAGS